MSDDAKNATKGSEYAPSILPGDPGAPEVVAGRYEVLGLLGVGGMGAVYKVRDRELDEVVALKMLRRDLAQTPGILERFRREVKLARRVTHPNVARTYDLGEHGGDRFITMELIAGESLGAVLSRQGRLSLTRATEILGPVCAGLAAAHAAGVVHRDLKPDNILIEARAAQRSEPRISGGVGGRGVDSAPGPSRRSGELYERVAITDFGIARAEEGSGAQRTMIPVGTPAYMAPEQVEAAPDIDARADIYALGAMLYEMLTGQLPWQGDSVYAVAAMRLMQPPPDPRKLRPDLPDAVAQLVMRCMARRPEDRPASAAEVASRLASVTLPAAESLAGVSQPARAAPAEAAATDPGHKTVAVLPFRNAGPPEDEYLVDGLTDDLIDALSMTPGLRVRPRGVVMAMKGTSRDPREMGRELDVQVVVDGTVRTMGDALRVSARVLSVADGFQLWARRFEGTRSEVFRIGDEATQAIAGALTVRRPAERAVLTDPVAVDLYLRGRHEYFKFWAEATDRAAHLLEQAYQKAPDDPLIMAGYAAALARQFGLVSTPERHALARQVAERAVAAAPNLGEPHSALGVLLMHEGDSAGSAREVRQAMLHAPTLADAFDQAARMASETGPLEAALELTRRAIQLEPRLTHLRYNCQLRAFALRGEWDEVEKLTAIVPVDSDEANLYWVSRVRTATWRRDPAVAARILHEMEGAPPFSFSGMVQGFCNAISSRTLPPAVRQIFVQRTKDPGATARTRAFFHQLLAEMLGYLEDTDAALQTVEGAVNEGLFDVVWMDMCPILDGVRTRPRFAELRATVAERADRVRAELLGPG